MNKTKKKINKNIIINTAVIALSYILIFVLINGGLLNRQFTSLIVPIGINIMLAVSLKSITGFLGELTLGHASFMSIGAYTGALITLNMNAPIYVEFPLAIIVGGLMAAIFGFIIGMPVLR